MRKNNQRIPFHFYPPNVIHLLVFRQTSLGMWSEETVFSKALVSKFKVQFRYSNIFQRRYDAG